MSDGWGPDLTGETDRAEEAIAAENEAMGLTPDGYVADRGRFERHLDSFVPRPRRPSPRVAWVPGDSGVEEAVLVAPKRGRKAPVTACENRGCAFPKGSCDLDEMNRGAVDALDFVGTLYEFEHCLRSRTDEDFQEALDSAPVAEAPPSPEERRRKLTKRARKVLARFYPEVNVGPHEDPLVVLGSLLLGEWA